MPTLVFHPDDPVLCDQDSWHLPRRLSRLQMEKSTGELISSVTTSGIGKLPKRVLFPIWLKRGFPNDSKGNLLMFPGNLVLLWNIQTLLDRSFAGTLDPFGKQHNVKTKIYILCCINCIIKFLWNFLLITTMGIHWFGLETGWEERTFPSCGSHPHQAVIVVLFRRETVPTSVSFLGKSSCEGMI